MGCRTSNLKETVIYAIPAKDDAAGKRTEDNLNRPEDISEYSLRECSLIPIQTDHVNRRASDDPSMFGLIQDLQ